MPKLAAAPPADPRRRKLIGAVRAACARLGLADDDRRALQIELVGKASMSEMNAAELGRLLDHFNRDRSGPRDERPHAGKVRALWWTLYWLGEVDQAHDPAIDAFVRRQARVDSLRFLDHVRASAVIEALKAMAARAGVRWFDDATVAEIQAGTPGVTPAMLERHPVLAALQRRLNDRGIIHGSYVDYCTRALGLKLNQWMWSTREGDEAIRLLGRKLRAAIDAERAEAPPLA